MLTRHPWRHRSGHYRVGMLGPSLVLDADEHGPQAVCLIRTTRHGATLLDHGEGDRPVLVAGDPTRRCVVAGLNRRGLLLTRRPALGRSRRRVLREATAAASGEEVRRDARRRSVLMRVSLISLAVGCLSLLIGFLLDTMVFIYFFIALTMIAAVAGEMIRPTPPTVAPGVSQRPDRAQLRPWQRFLGTPLGHTALVVHSASFLVMAFVAVGARRDAAAPLLLMGFMLAISAVVVRSVGGPGGGPPPTEDRRAARLVVSLMLASVGVVAVIGSAIGILRPGQPPG